MRSIKLHLSIKIVYTCLIFLCFLLIAQRSKEDIKHVNNLEDFRVHTSTHIQNVYRLGMHLYYEHRNTQFKNVPEHILREKLLMHDSEKLASLESLKNIGYKGDLTFSERLYEHFGKNKEQSKDSIKIKNLINELNTYAKYNDNELYKKYGYINSDGSPNSIAENISLIEKIADLVERERNPITHEEMGRPRSLKAFRYVKSKREKYLANNLAKVYSQIVQPNPLIYIVKLNRPKHLKPHCSALFQ